MTAGEATFDLRFVRNFTVEPVQPWLTRELDRRGVRARVSYGEFAGAAADVFSLGAGRDDEARGVTILALALEMSSSMFGHAGWDAGAACSQLLELVRVAVESSRRPLVLNTFLPPLHPPAGLATPTADADQVAIVEAANQELRRLAGNHPGRVVLLDWCAYARELGEAGTYDFRFWRTAGAPFATPFMKRYARDLSLVVEALSGRARKCLVLDCDNTLWGGVIGEDGVEGIALSSNSAPGHHFQAFQRSVLDLLSQGVLLALCSKNNEDDVFEVLDRHPDCVIRREHLAAWRINWDDKASSLLAIAEELNLGLDSFVFVDDSPQECARVSEALPMVLVLQSPADPAEHALLLPRHRPFARLEVTAEDALRTRSYQQERERAKLSTCMDIGEYKRQLGTVLTFRAARDEDLPRLVQLFQRTNQFNLTTGRYDAPTVRSFLADPQVLVHCAEVGDKFGELGLVAVSVVRRDGEAADVDSLLMSCRALGRDAEFAYVACLAEAVQAEWQPSVLRARYLPTKKNGQVADFWARAGMRQQPGNDAVERNYVVDDMVAFAAKNRVPYVAING